MTTGQRHRKNRQYLNREPKREPYDRVLLICEGQKTEPLYFRRMLVVHRLSSVNVTVRPSPTSDPLNLVTYAEEQAAEYDRTFCVFDRDRHPTFDDALGRLTALRTQGTAISGIVSWPCFEFWLLLHFEYTAQGFASAHGRSSCDQVIRRLRTYLPRYEKGQDALYDTLLPHQEVAVTHATRLAKDNRATNSTNPSTGIHELIGYLSRLRVP